MADQEIRKDIRAYVTLHLEIQKAKQALKEVTEKRDELGAVLFKRMKEDQIDSFKIPDDLGGGKIELKTTKLKKKPKREDVERILVERANFNRNDAQDLYEYIFVENCTVEEKESIACKSEKAAGKKRKNKSSE